MYLSKKQSRLIATAIVVVFFVIVFSMIRTPTLPRNTRSSTLSTEQQPLPSATPAMMAVVPLTTPDGSQGSQVTLKQFHRSEVKNGKKIWEIDASRGEFKPEENIIKVYDATLWLYRDGDSPVQLKADHAALKVKGTELGEATVEGHVVVVYGKVVITTDKAIYNQSKDTVIAPGVAEVSSDLMHLSGEVMTVKVSTRQVRFAKNVKSRIKPRGKNVS